MDQQKTGHNIRVEFGTDGIRGVAGQPPLDPLTVLHIGRGMGRWLRMRHETPRVLIGQDTRISGYTLAGTLAGGLLAEGVAVDQCGVMTTPSVSYLTRVNDYSLGIVISASHNPVEQNGIKVFGPDGFKLDDADERALERVISAPDSEHIATSFGMSNHVDYAPAYLEHLTANFGFHELTDLTLIVDCANGPASRFAEPALGGDRGARVGELNAESDGYSINLNAGSEHVRRHRKALLEAMREDFADLGMAFDGDADRVVFVTPEGMLIDGDHILGILALELKAQGRLHGDTVVATDMSNSGLEHFLNAHGIVLKRTKVGDKYVMEAMRQGGYVLGGEQAGHIILLDGERTAGDGIYVGLLVASIVARSKRNGGPSLHELASRIPRYPQVIASAHLRGKVDLKTVNGLAALIENTLAAFDGKGRVNVRFSGTEPNLLRAMVEGGPDNTLEQTIERAEAICGLVADATGTNAPRIDIVDCVTGAPVQAGATGEQGQ